MADAADKIVEVPGMGNVSFPGTMTDDDISSVIRSNVATQNLQKQVSKYPQSFQESPEAAQARGDKPDLSQAGLTERLWQPLTTGLVSPSTITRAISGHTPEELQQRVEQREAAGKSAGLPGIGISAGRVLSPLTSPVSLGTAALGSIGEVPGAIGTAAKATLLGVSPAMAAQGGIESARGLEKGVSTPEGAEEFLSGAGQMAGGLAGMREGAKLLPRPNEFNPEWIAGSMTGPEPKNQFESVSPTAALVREGIVAPNRASYIKKIGNRIGEINTHVQGIVDQSATAPPENLPAIIRDATNNVLNLAQTTEGEKSTIAGVARDILNDNPENPSLRDLLDIKQKINKREGMFKSGPEDEPGKRAMFQAVAAGINQALERRIPGIREWTQREGGLINARDMLENKERISKGSPLLPLVHGYAGIEGGTPYIGALGMRIPVPEGTLPKTLAIKALGQRVELPELTHAPTLRIRGLLGTGPIYAGPSPDTSFVTGIPAREEAPEVIRFGRLLPVGEGQGPLVMPPSPLSPSFGSELTPTGGARGFTTEEQPPIKTPTRIEMQEPKTVTVRDPKTGKMKRIYLGEPKERK